MRLLLQDLTGLYLTWNEDEVQEYLYIIKIIIHYKNTEMRSEISHMRLTLEKTILWWLALIAIISIALPRFL